MPSKYENDTASIASTSTFSSTISLLKNKLKPSPFKSSYPSTKSQDYPRWGPLSDLDPAMAPKSSSKSSQSKEKRSKKSDDVVIKNIGIGPGAITYTPYRSSYPDISKDYPKWGPKSDLDEKMLKAEEKKAEKEQKRRERAVMMAERKRMDRELTQFHYTNATLMRA